MFWPVVRVEYLCPELIYSGEVASFEINVSVNNNVYRNININRNNNDSDNDNDDHNDNDDPVDDDDDGCTRQLDPFILFLSLSLWTPLKFSLSLRAFYIVLYSRLQKFVYKSLTTWGKMVW